MRNDYPSSTYCDPELPKTRIIMDLSNKINKISYEVTLTPRVLPVFLNESEPSVLLYFWGADSPTEVSLNSAVSVLEQLLDVLEQDPWG